MDGTAAGRQVAVVGIGHPDRGDDAVGPAVVRHLRRLLGSRTDPQGTGTVGVTLVEQADPAQLLDLWDGVDLVVVVDAVRCDGPPGSVVVRDLADPDAGREDGWASGGTHALGVLGAVELGRALGILPATIAVGIVAGGVDLGADLSPAVAAAVDRAGQVVLELLVEHGVEVQQDPPAGTEAPSRHHDIRQEADA